MIVYFVFRQKKISIYLGTRTANSFEPGAAVVVEAAADAAGVGDAVEAEVDTIGDETVGVVDLSRLVDCAGFIGMRTV